MIKAPSMWVAAATLLVPASIASAAQSTIGGVAARPVSGRPATAGLSLSTFQARHERKLLAADSDGDGRVSKAEFLASARSGKGDPARQFTRLDRNGDGNLDGTEIDRQLARRFQRIDADGDGMLSLQERAASKGKTRAGQGGSRS